MCNLSGLFVESFGAHMFYKHISFQEYSDVWRDARICFFAESGMRRSISLSDFKKKEKRKKKKKTAPRQENSPAHKPFYN